MESVVNNNYLCIYNNKSPTFSGCDSAMDLYLCDPSVFMDFSWKVLMHTYGSDHFPICPQKLEENDKNPKQWNLSRANWEEFQKLCSKELKKDQVSRT